MKILTDRDLGQHQDLASYREVAWGNLIFGTLFAGAATVFGGLPFVEPGWSGSGSIIVCGLAAVLFSGLAAIALGAFRSSLAPENRLLRWSSQRIYLRYRSFYNSGFPEDTPTIICLEHSEIRGLRGFRLELDSPDEYGAWTLFRKIHGLEIELKRVDHSILRDALAKEAEQRSPKGSRYNHYPVTLTRQGDVRVELRGAKKVLERLATYFPVYPPEQPEVRLFESLPDEEKEEHILALALAGDKIGAVKAARQHYRCGLKEAKTFVECLLKR